MIYKLIEDISDYSNISKNDSDKEAFKKDKVCNKYRNPSNNNDLS